MIKAGRTQQGISLVETMVTLMVMTILLSVGVPAYQDLSERNQIASLANEFRLALSLARSEAIKQGDPVSICPSNAAGTACGNAADWDNGWFIFLDPNGNGNLADTNVDGLLNEDDGVVRMKTTLAGNENLVSANGIITFGTHGFPTAGAGAAGTYTVSVDGCSGNNARLLQVANTGRVRVGEAACN